MNEKFLSSSVPASYKERSRAVRTKWYGLNLNASADSGYITCGRNFRVTSEGSVRAFGGASELKWKHLSEKDIDGVSVKPLAFCGIDGVLFCVFEHSGKASAARLEPSLGGMKILEYEESALTAKIGGKTGFKRHLAQYSVWCGGSDVISGEYSKRLLIYPDKARLDFDGGWGAKAEDIAGYDVYKKTEVTVSEKTETFNSGWSIASDGDVVISGEPDGTSEDVSKTEESVLYGYADESDLIPDGYTAEDEPSVSYSVNSGKGSDGADIEYLIRRTKNVLTKVSFSAKKRADVLPDTELAAVWGNRLFGTDGSKIFASSAGSYLDFSLDTAADSDGGNAWYGTSRTGGDFTAVCVYGGRITAFKEDGLYELYGDENPFRLKQISAKGTFSSESVCEADSVLYYAGRDGIYAYSGSYPRNISEAVLPLGAFKDGYLSSAAGGTDGVRYFLRAPLKEDDTDKPVLVYDTSTGFWSIVSFTESTDEPEYFASDGRRAYCMTESGRIYALNGEISEGFGWYFEASPELGGTAGLKNLEKLSMTAKFHTAGKISVSAELDGKKYVRLGTFSQSAGTSSYDCLLRNCGHAVRKLRFDCEGDVEILCTEFTVTEGGEPNAGKRR